MRGVRVVIARFKWNYFNDVIYSIYFSIMLFAFSQLYDLELRTTSSLTSILLAFLFIILGLLLPFFLVCLLKNNERELVESSLSKERAFVESNLRKIPKEVGPSLREE